MGVGKTILFLSADLFCPSCSLEPIDANSGFSNVEPGLSSGFLFIEFNGPSIASATPLFRCLPSFNGKEFKGSELKLSLFESINLAVLESTLVAIGFCTTLAVFASSVVTSSLVLADKITEVVSNSASSDSILLVASNGLLIEVLIACAELI